MSDHWTTEGFEAFRKGTFGNGGQNIYVSRKGVLQRIHQTDVTRNGYMDLIFCNSQNHEELVPIAVYPDPVAHPENKRDLYIGGASDAVVTDLTGDGAESMVWSCGWDGKTKLNPAAIYYGSEEGPSAKYINYLPANLSHAVTSGDFNGDGRVELAFLSENVIKIFRQDEYGFCAKNMDIVESKDVKRLAAFRFEGETVDSLLILKENGSIVTLTGGAKGFEGVSEVELIPADGEYKKTEFSWDSYTQFVSEPAPHLQIVSIYGKPHLPVFRKSQLLLYPCTSRKLGKPIVLKCRNCLAVAAGDVFHRGECDLVVACREEVGTKETSYIYLGNSGNFSENNRLPIPSYKASDVALGRFSGDKGLDIVICQSHTLHSYDSHVLIFSTGTLTAPAIPDPSKLPSHDASRILVVKDTRGRDYLVIGHSRSGSFIGNPDNCIYCGSAGGYHTSDCLTLPGWGSVDAVCCDLNDNGRPDIVFANASELAPWMDQGSYVYYQQADGSYLRQPQRLKTSRAHGVVCGDLNHNGYLDLVFCGFDNPVLKIFYGSAEGYSEERSKEIRLEDENGHLYKQPRFIGLADLNGDGYLDLILTQITEDESFVLWNGPDGFDFKRRQTFRVHHSCNCKVADLNGNGYPDLIWGGHTQTLGKPLDAFAHIYWGGPDGYSESRKTLLPSNAINSISVADFNNDGLLDIFLASYENGVERDLPSFIYWNSPEGFHANDRTELHTHAVSGSIAADLDGDGYVDLAVANHKYNGCHVGVSTVWYNGKNGFDPAHTTDLPTRGPHGMGNVDPGNIMDRSFDEFYESEPHEIPAGCGISGICWQAEIPHKCGVFAQFRTADTLEELSKRPWEGPLNAETRFNAHDVIDPYHFQGKFMQYRLILYAYNALNTPRVTSVTVDFQKL